MAIFSFKSKAKKTEEKEEDVVEPIESKPAQPSKFVPRHGQRGRTESSQSIEKLGVPANTSHPRDTAVTTPHGATTSSSLGRRIHSNDAFTTHANDYFSPSTMRKLQANDPSLGYAKVAIARYDQGLAHYSSDSGYESAGPSRVPSEQNLSDMPRQPLSIPNGGLLPEPKLSDDARSDMSSKSAPKKTRFQVDTDPVALPEQRSANLAALEGFKVNKKGKVLDEEGEVIGELVEGDLLDCVRQKVNAKGEVVDDVGKVVGIVKLATATLPSLAVVTPNGGQTYCNAEGEVSPIIAPRSPSLDAVPQEAPRRPARSASERSLSELSKPYARPPMSSVPENNVPGEDGILAQPEMFAYKVCVHKNDAMNRLHANIWSREKYLLIHASTPEDDLRRRLFSVLPLASAGPILAVSRLVACHQNRWANSLSAMPQEDSQWAATTTAPIAVTMAPIHPIRMMANTRESACTGGPPLYVRLRLCQPSPGHTSPTPDVSPLTQMLRHQCRSRRSP